MTKTEILSRIISDEFKTICKRVDFYNSDDLFQEMYLVFNGMTEDYLNRNQINSERELRQFYASVAVIQAKTKNGAFYRKYHRLQMFEQYHADGYRMTIRIVETFEFELKTRFQQYAEREIEKVRPGPKKFKPELMPSLFNQDIAA